MAPRLIGKPLPRKEDHRLLTGRGRFSDDVNAPGQAYAAFLRSPHAHARIERIDTVDAASHAGVLAVLTGRDYAADGHSAPAQYHIPADHLDPTRPALADNELSPLPEPSPIAANRVRHVGEIVALAVAETREAALDALERIAVDYEPLPAAVDAKAAAAPDAPRIWGRDNVCLRAEAGDAAATEAAFAAAHRVVRLALHNHRIYACPMEPRSALGEFDPGSGRYTLHAPSQGVHRFKRSIAAAFGVDQDSVRIVTGDVGGGFGVRSACSNEYPLLLWAARRCARPVKWNGSRSEAFLSDYHARDIHAEGALALDAANRIVALRIDYLGNVGAYPISFAVLTNLKRMAGPPYDIPAMHVSVRGVFTNTIPVSVYRGAGRPEVTQVVERLIDLAADEAGMDRAVLRRRNLIGPDALPYGSGLGLSYDSGAFGENFEAALKEIDWDGFPARRAAARARGKRAGIGIVTYLESPGAAPYERTDVAVRPDGAVEASIGTQASGQGHETSFAQVVAETLEIPFEQIEIVFGDSDRAVDGSGSHADRSMRLGGTILFRAARRIVEDGREAAARLLEAASSDIDYADGRFTVVGTDRSIGLYEIAAEEPLSATEEVSTRLHAHPNGAAACEVEIDPETGELAILRYVAVDDVGRAINPMIVEGQIHGGIAQGIGQALFERTVHDPGSGQLLSGSFMDYCLPRADDLPSFSGRVDGRPTANNPLGVKGAGEAGTTPATAVIVSAATDALRGYGVTHLEMPLTPERIWRAIRAG